MPRLLLVTFFAVLLVRGQAVPAFYKDVLPVLQKRCQSCHRAGEIGPMPLFTYAEVKPWSAAIRESVKLRKMPPWFADSCCGKFSNDPSLTQEELRIIDQWVAGGAPAGSKKDAPAPRQWPEGWAVSPDVTFKMRRPFTIPAKAVVDYQYIVIPTTFSADRWVQAVEVRPKDRSIVHHAVLYVREPGSSWLKNVPPQTMYSPAADQVEERIAARGTTADILAVYTPGSPVSAFPPGMAKKIAAGSDLVLQLHYTSKDDARTDQTEIGLVIASQRPSKRLLTLQMGKDDLRIPPGDPNYRTSVSGTVPRDALLVSLFPHMHLRGKSFDFEIVGPDGHVEPLLRVHPFLFNWQLSYELQQPRLLKAGTRLRWTGTFDNSGNNSFNPDPSAEVVWGEQSWEEMMIGFFDVAVDPEIDKATFFLRER